MVWMALYFRFITKEWVYYVYFSLAILVFSLIGIFFIPESGKFLYERGRFDDARKTFKYIAKFNGKKDIDIDKLRFDLEDNPD